MTAVSTLLVVKNALVDGIGGLSAFTTPQIPVSWSHPGGTIERTHAWVGGARTGAEQALQTFDGTRDEAYEIDVVVSAIGPGKTAEAIETEALTLAAAVETYVTDNPSLGINPTDIDDLNVSVAGVALEPYMTDNGRGADITIRVAVTALMA